MQAALIGPPPREIHFPGRGLTVADLNEIYSRLGSIGSSVESMQREMIESRKVAAREMEKDREESRRHREAILKQQVEHGKEIAQLRRRLEISEDGIQRLGSDLDKVKPLVDEVQRWRQRGIGFAGGLMFLGMIAGVLGAKYVTPFLQALGFVR